MVGIYKIQSPSNSVYIGQSWDVNKRFVSHKYKPKNAHLINSFAKYGKENHVFTLIHELPNDCTQEVMDQYECLYIDIYSNCYKLINIRGGGYNGKASNETKAKMSKAATGKIVSDITRKKLSDLNKGEKHPKYGTKNSEETRLKISIANKGKKMPEHVIELTRKRSLGNKNMLGKKHTEESKIKMSIGNMGKKHSEEVKRKRSEDITLWWAKRKQTIA